MSGLHSLPAYSHFILRLTKLISFVFLAKKTRSHTLERRREFLEMAGLTVARDDWSDASGGDQKKKKGVRNAPGDA